LILGKKFNLIAEFCGLKIMLQQSHKLKLTLIAADFYAMIGGKQAFAPLTKGPTWKLKYR
jgi:hypothetical protein